MIAEFHFLRPGWLLLILPLLFLIWRYWQRQQQAGAWQAACDPHLLSQLLLDKPQAGSRRPVSLLGIAGLLAIVALAGPTWSKLPQPVYRNTAATVVLINLSESMNAADVIPSRLERAKLKLLDFLRSQREGQTALIAYAGEAYVVSPLTDDSETIASLVTALQSNIMPVQGDNLSQAFAKAEALLNQDGVFRGGRILLITDDAGNKQAIKDASELARKGRVISVLAVGTAQGAPIKSATGGFVQNAQGGILISRLDQAALSRLAAAGHGHLVGLTPDDSDLRQLWPGAQAARINRQQSRQHQDADIWREQGPWLLLLVLPLVALSWRYSGLGILVCMVMLHPHPAQAADWNTLWSRPDQRAYRALQAGQPTAAARLFKNPDWRSVAEYRAGNYAEAAKGFSGKTTPQALYNAANALAHLGKLQQAAHNYRQVLKQQPNNADARHNLEIVEKLLKQRQQQHPKSQASSQHRQTGNNSKPSHAGQQGKGNGQTSGSHQTQTGSAQHKSHQHSRDKSGTTTNTQQDSTSNGQPKDKSAQKTESHQRNAGKQDANEQERKSSAQKSVQASDAKTKPTTNPAQDDQPDQSAQASVQQKESRQALQQWLRRIPDDPGGLLRRKFEYLHQQRQQANHSGGN